MQRTTLSGIAIAIGSSLIPVAILFMVTFGLGDYFVVYTYGSIRLIDSDFYILVGIITFEIVAFVFGMVSAIQSFRRKTYNLSIVGSAFVLTAGILFFIPFFVRLVSPILMQFYVYVWWSIIQTFCGIPMIILSSISLLFFVARKKETVG